MASSANSLLRQRGSYCWPHKKCRNVGDDFKRQVELSGGIGHAIQGAPKDVTRHVTREVDSDEGIECSKLTCECVTNRTAWGRLLQCDTLLVVVVHVQLVYRPGAQLVGQSKAHRRKVNTTPVSLELGYKRLEIEANCEHAGPERF